MSAGHRGVWRAVDMLGLQYRDDAAFLLQSIVNVQEPRGEGGTERLMTLWEARLAQMDAEGRDEWPLAFGATMSRREIVCLLAEWRGEEVPAITPAERERQARIDGRVRHVPPLPRSPVAIEPGLGITWRHGRYTVARKRAGRRITVGRFDDYAAARAAALAFGEETDRMRTEIREAA